MTGGTGEGNQEQIQIIATAIGKPMPKAAAIVDVNAKSKSCSGCTLLSSGMALLHQSGSQSRQPDEAVTVFRFAHTVQKPRAKACIKMVNEV
jgi:hypothetical protein